MRTMSIPPFPDRVEILDFAAFTKARLAGEFKSSEQGPAVPSKRRRDLKNIAQKFQNLEDALTTRKRERRHTQNSVPTVATFIQSCGW
jgi:hypothetical protein